MKNVILFCFLLVTTFTQAQEVSFEKKKMEAAQLLGTVNFGEVEDDFETSLQSLEAPYVSGPSYKNYLAELKNQIRTLHPPKKELKVETRGAADPPRIIRSWKGNSASVGTPLDTHLAASNDGQVTFLHWTSIHHPIYLTHVYFMILIQINGF